MPTLEHVFCSWAHQSWRLPSSQGCPQVQREKIGVLYEDRAWIQNRKKKKEEETRGGEGCRSSCTHLWDSTGGKTVNKRGVVLLGSTCEVPRSEQLRRCRVGQAVLTETHFFCSSLDSCWTRLCSENKKRGGSLHDFSRGSASKWSK